MSSKMTADQATTFEHGKSEMNAAALDLTAQERGCTCAAYRDWFTYKRWLGQGYQVQRGQTGTRLTTFKPIFKGEGDEKTRVGSRPLVYSVFCRCQVKAKGK